MAEILMLQEQTSVKYVPVQTLLLRMTARDGRNVAFAGAKKRPMRPQDKYVPVQKPAGLVASAGFYGVD
jgi:hypothetical protein